MNRKPLDLESFEAAAAELQPLCRAGCPTIQVLRAAGLDALPEDLQFSVSAHLQTCASCRTLQADLVELPQPLDATARELQKILAQTHQRQKQQQTASVGRHGSTFFWRAAMVTAGLVLCVGLLVWQSRNQATQPSPAPSPLVVQQVAPGKQSPDALKLQKPIVKMALSVLTWRGADNNQEQFLKDIASALDLYRADRFAEAAAHLEPLSSKYRNSVEVFFYLGVSRLLLGDFTKACVSLEHASRLADDAFSADISWYLALGYQRSGRFAEARVLLSDLCSQQNEYRDRACATLKELDHAPTAQPQDRSSPKRQP